MKGSSENGWETSKLKKLREAKLKDNRSGNMHSNNQRSRETLTIQTFQNTWAVRHRRSGRAKRHTVFQKSNENQMKVKRTVVVRVMACFLDSHRKNEINKTNSNEFYLGIGVEKKAVKKSSCEKSTIQESKFCVNLPKSKTSVGSNVLDTHVAGCGTSYLL